MTFTVAQAAFFGLCMKLALWGIYFGTFLTCIQALFFQRSRLSPPIHVSSPKPRIRWPIAFITIALYLITTADLFIELARVYRALLLHAADSSETLSKFTWFDVARDILLVLTDMIADGMLIYRCFAVYSRSILVIVMPCLTWLGFIITAMAYFFVSITLPRSTQSGAILRSRNIWIEVGAALTLVNNLMTTAMIAWRLTSVSRASNDLRMRTDISAGYGDRETPDSFQRRSGRNSVQSALRIIVESGAMISASLLAFAVMAFVDNAAFMLVSDCTGIIMAISFNLIIIRVWQNRTIDSEAESLRHTFAARPGMQEDSLS